MKFEVFVVNQAIITEIKLTVWSNLNGKKISKHEISTASISLKQTTLHIGAQKYKGASIVYSVYYLNLTYGISGEKFQVADVTLKKFVSKKVRYVQTSRTLIAIIAR